MTKFKIIMSILLISIGLLSCKNGITSDSFPPTETKPSEFTGPKLPVENTPSCNRLIIDRRNVSKNEPWITKYMDCWDFNGKDIFDYFVIPGDIYEYKMTYKKDIDGRSSTSTIEKHFITTASSEGIGELKFATNPVAHYDPNTTIMTFDTIPSFPQTFKDKLSTQGKLDEFFCIRYISTDGTRLDSQIKKQIDFSKEIPKTHFGKTFNLRQIDGYISVNRISYNYVLPAENFPEIATIITKQIPNLTINADYKDGIEITFPTDIKCQEWALSKKKVGDTSKNKYYIFKKYNSSESKQTVIDYFVEPNTEYEYDYWANFEDGSQQYFHNPTIVKAKNGLGEFMYAEKLQSKYDNKTSIMTFTSLPNFSDPIQSLIDNNNGSVWSNLFYNNSYNRQAFKAEIKETIKCADHTYQDEFDKDLHLSTIHINLELNGSTFRTELYDSESFSNLQSIINVPSSAKITFKLNPNHPDGVEVIFPDGIKCDEWVVTKWRKSEDNRPNTYQYYIIMNNLTSPNGNKLIDYFVEPGVEYIYSAWYNIKDGGQHVLPYKISTTAQHGLGEFNYTTKPKSTFHKDTCTMTFDTMPQYSQKIEEFIKKGKLHQYVTYSLSNGNGAWRADLAESIPCREHLWRDEDLGKELLFDSLSSFYRIDNLSFEMTHNDKDYYPHIAQSMIINK